MSGDETKILVLEEALKPKSSALEFAVLTSIRKLVVAAVEVKQSTKMSPHRVAENGSRTRNTAILSRNSDSLLLKDKVVHHDRAN
jgi:hypothetical protein